MSLNGKNICITGGAGFIGCNLTNHLLDSGVKTIHIIDDLSSGNKEFLPIDDRIIFNHCDISNFEKYNFIFPKDVDYVYHLAAHFANQNSVDYPLSDAKANIMGILNTLEIVKELNIKKLIYTSSSCVYGDSKVMKETDYIYPFETPYAINKFAGELYVKFFSHFYNIPSLSVRIFNTFGPYELDGKYRNVIPKFINRALKNKDIFITGDGNETRDFTYIDDTIDLLIKMTLSNIDDGDVFNSGTGNPTKIIDLANSIIKICESNSKIVFKERRNWDKVTDRLSNINKSKEKLNYNPSVKLEEGLMKTIKWYEKLK
tara:strand:- start:2292 stop:3239 length:948 start_codon:yes stop_codon:yes gene_type:complete